jgi:hypothetical protein
MFQEVDGTGLSLVPGTNLASTCFKKVMGSIGKSRGHVCLDPPLGPERDEIQAHHGLVKKKN